MLSRDIFLTINGVLENAMEKIIDGLYNGSHTVFSSSFFESALAISIGVIGYLIMFRKLKDEEIAYKIIWTLMVFSVVYTILYNQTWYDYLIEILDLPRDAFTELIKSIVVGINNEATIGNVINRIHNANISLVGFLWDMGGVTNPIPVIYGLIVWLIGSFLVIVILLTAVFSVFLSQIVLALLPLILPFLIWKKTEYIFFNWAKLYISISLYAPFTLLFGLISIEVANLSVDTLNAMQNDFKSSIVYLASLIITQLLVALAIFKIPNIINQIIGSSNEGTSLTSGVGTISAGAAMVGTFSKYTGMKFAGKHIGAQAGRAGRVLGAHAMDKVKENAPKYMDKIRMR